MLALIILIVVVALFVAGISGAFMEDSEAFTGTLVFSIVIILLAAVSIAAYMDDRDAVNKKLHKKDVTICKLQHGKLVKDVCVLGKVVTIK